MIKRGWSAIRRRLTDPRLTETNALLVDIRWELKQQRKYLEGFRALASTPIYAEIREFTEARQYTFEETMRRVAQERLSLARFGDGELKIMLRPQFGLKFQPWSAGLAGELRAVLEMDGYDPDRLLVAFPYTIRDVHWTGVWLDLWPEVKPLLNPDVHYGSAHVTRPVFFAQLGERGVQLWRDVWDGQRICVVTGEGSRFKLEPALFGNAKSVEFLYSTPRDAYADLSRLKNELERREADMLYLLALGPCGTLVAAWLSQRGRWAIDMGHISESWANVFAGGAWPESLEVVNN